MTGYKIDYVGQLCRTGKVESKRIGRTWFVNEDSILKHKEAASQGGNDSRISEKSKIEQVKLTEEAIPTANEFASLPIQNPTHKSDTNSQTSLPRHFHLFGEASADSMTRLLSLFIVAVLFSTILIAKENNPFPAAANLLKTTGTAVVANVSLAPVHFATVAMTSFEVAVDYDLEILSHSGDHVLNLVKWFGESYLGVVRETARIGDLFTDSPIANAPSRIFTAGTKLFGHLYQNLGANLRRDVVAIVQSDFSDKIINGPVRLSEKYVAGVWNLARLYQNLGVNFRNNLVAFGGSGVVVKYPAKFTTGFLGFFQDLSGVYQRLGSDLRFDLATYPKTAVVAVYPKVFSQSFNNFSHNFAKLYQGLGVLARVSAVVYLRSDLAATYPLALSQSVNALSQNFTNLYQNLGFDFRSRVANVGSSKFVSAMFGWPTVASNGLASAIQTVPSFYQTLGFNFRNQVGQTMGRIAKIGRGSPSVAAVSVAVATKSESQVQASSWFGNLKNSVEDLSLRVIAVLRLAKGEILEGLTAGYSDAKSLTVSGFGKVVGQVGLVFGKVVEVPTVLYRAVASILSGEYYSRLTQYLNISQQSSEMNIGGVLATKADNERRGIAVKPSVSAIADEAAKNEIRETFSDTVEVIPDETGQSGIVKPNFKSGRNSAYIYVLVPVKQ